MFEKIKEYLGDSGKKIEIATVGATLLLALSGCDNIRQRRINRLENKVEKLEGTQELQANDYSDISDQHNIQLDLQNEGADPTINQDIYLSGSLGTKKDKDIEKTTTEYRKAKEKLMKLKEEQGKRVPNYTDPAGRMNPDKYGYKKEQFRRMGQKRQGAQKNTEECKKYQNEEHPKQYECDESTRENLN